MKMKSLAAGVLPCLVLGAAACGAGAPSGHPGGGVTIVAAENFWGSIAAQLAGAHAHVQSVITNPQTDPHAYEAAPSDGRAFANAQLVIENGAGYDPWAQKVLDANPNPARVVLDVGKLNGVAEGGNPHMWYSQAFVTRVVDQVTTDLQQLDPPDAPDLRSLHDAYLSNGLRQYNDLHAQIRQRYAGVAVGSTESIFAYMANDLQLNLVSPPGFMKAVSEGTDVVAADKTLFDQQITSRQIKVLVFNTQNSTPDVQALVDKARAEGIPVPGITETLDPQNLTFQDWQSKELQGILDALSQAVK
ncbi:MAG: metal ABC transporter solute-binding protein, Zn/Mn family [Candidatus Dormibacteria bacterium]